VAAKLATNALIGAILAVVLGFLVICALLVLYLDHTVTRQFEGRRWTLPAQVYAQPLELYAGLSLSADELQRELDRLHYQRAEQLTRPGSYRRQGGRIDLVSRRVELWDEVSEPQVVRVAAGPGRVEGLWDARGAVIPILRLDPLLIGSIFPIHGEDRIVVSPQEVPPLLPAALKVVEDRKFDTHHGIDPEAILRALWVNLRAGRIEQGGSTLTQQLVRSYFLDDRQTVARKLKEAVMALILDARFEKADLMNAYINEIYLGQDGQRAIHGFGLASRFYFGKPLEELELSEIALLVAIVRGPSWYDPRTHAERARARRDLVLKQMAQFEVVSAAAAREAMARPLGVVDHGQFAGGYFPAYLDFVRRTLKRDYHEQDLTEAGLKIFTALDPRAQAQAEQSLARELSRLDRLHSKKGSPPLEGAVVVTAPQSGEVIALVGGRRVGFDGFNRVLDARRSIGSLIKPAVYLTALESGRYTAASLIQDEPIEVPLPNGTRWRPENFSHQTAGPVPLVRALAESLNLATVHLGLDVGVPKVAQTLARLGVEQPVEPVPALLLGAADLAPLEVAEFYGTLANGGFRTPLRAVRAVVGADGKRLKSFALEVTPVVDPVIVYQLNRMLVLAVERGTGQAARARLPAALVVAGKTGTSSDFRDSWFAGFSGSHLAVVWVGYDDNRSTGLTGAAGASAIWSQLMSGLNSTSLDLPLPESLEEASIEFSTGYGARPECASDVVVVAVPRGTQPPMKPGCASNPLENLADRARDWLRGVIH
jgi:penicillin-binding protein 1B